MPFQSDTVLASDAGEAFGQYLISFISKTRQVRADIFRRGQKVEAHVSFPTGMDATNVTDPYASELWQYAREHEFADRFRLILS